MLAGKGNWALRLRYRAACEAGAPYRLPSHANPGKERRRGGQERRALALVSAERKTDCRNDARFEGTTLEGTILGGSVAVMLPRSPWRLFLRSYHSSSLQASLPSAPGHAPVR